MSCDKDLKTMVVVYPSVDYMEEYNQYGERVFQTLKPTHSKGEQITQVQLCTKCKLRKARPQAIEDKLRTIQRAEEISSIGDWTVSQTSLAKKLGLTAKWTGICGQCGKMDKVRNDKTRKPLCETCYTNYRRNYMRDFMRQKRESTHVD